jgi:hypothetical protein
VAYDFSAALINGWGNPKDRIKRSYFLMNEANDVPDFSTEEKKLFQFLLIYCAGVTLCRLLGSGMRFISLLDWMMFRQDVVAGSAFAAMRRFPIQRLPYILMPFVGLFWLRGRRSRAGLFFVGGMSAVGIASHIGAFIPFVFYGMLFWGRFVPPSLRITIALALAAGFAFLSRRIFQLTRFLYEQKKGAEDSRALSIALLALVFCFVTPFVNYGAIARRVSIMLESHENVTLLKRGSDIYFMDGSPGGKLLAVAAEDGLSVWDVKSRQCVWSDDSIVAVRRVRFSPDGRYLAAAGRGAPEGASDLAVFEMNEFRRLPGFDWPEEDLRKKKTFHDLSFRPDEQSLLVAWHQDWDWNRMSSAQKETVRQQDTEERLKRNPLAEGRDRAFFCTEWNMADSDIRHTNLIRDLDEFYDLLREGGIYFSPDASSLFYPRWYNRANRMYRVDTRDWTEEEILLDVKYSMETRTWALEDSKWYEWKFTRDGKTAYLLARGGGAFLVLKMNMTTKQTEELRRVPVTRSSERDPWIRIALSPDERRAALLGYGERLYDYGGTETHMVTLRILNLRTGKPQRFAYKHNGGRSIALRLVWLFRGTLAVSMSDRDGFFFVDIEKGE